MKWRVLSLTILVYVTLDLSLPAMPGAFVFEPADSVESTHVSNGRSPTQFLVVSAAPTEASLLPPPRVDVHRSLAFGIEVEHRRHPVVSRLFRPSGDASPPSEDPH